ncbi:MAG: DnaD domain protein [Lachnospira pectinoschiza]
MSSLILSTESSEGYTSVSNIFISEYVPGANGEFVKVYLYLLHLMSLRSNNISISLLADTFNQTEADIMRALRYWDSLDVISLSFNGPGNGLSNIVLRDIKHTGQAANAMADPIAAESASVNSTSSYQTETVRAAKPDIKQTEVIYTAEPSKVSYSKEQLNGFLANDNFSMLLFVIEQYMGRPLSTKETNSIVYFYDGLKLSTDLIEYLFEYCVEHNKKSINYIEKVALSWASKNIHTIAEAKEETSNHTDYVYQIMKAFGLSNREPAQHEKAMIAKWADTYCFDTDMIIEACNRTIKAIHQPSFEYADTILANWKNSNVSSLEDVKSRCCICRWQQYSLNRQLQSRLTTVLTISSKETRSLMTGTIHYLATITRKV